MGSRQSKEGLTDSSSKSHSNRYSTAISNGSGTIVVRGVEDIRVQSLRLFFRSRWRSGGGEIKSLDISKKPSGCWVAEVSFKRTYVATRMLRNGPLKLQGRTLKIQPAIPTRPTPSMPRSAAAEKVVHHPASLSTAIGSSPKSHSSRQISNGGGTIVVRGVEDISAHSLRLFFGSRWRSGGGEIKSLDIFKKTSGCWVAEVAFKHPHVATRMLKNGPVNHQGQILKIQPVVLTRPIVRSTAPESVAQHSASSSTDDKVATRILKNKPVNYQGQILKIQPLVPTRPIFGSAAPESVAHCPASSSTNDKDIDDIFSGVVVTSNAQKQFGFIRPDYQLPHRFTQKDVYFRYCNAVGQLSKGEQVSFTLDPKNRAKPQARKVWNQYEITKRGTRDTGEVLRDAFVVYDQAQALPTYIMHYTNSGVDSVPNIRSLQLQAMNQTGIKWHNIKAKRAVDMEDPLDVHFRIAESQVLRLSQRTGKQMEITSVDYYINPPLVTKFEAKSKDLQTKYGNTEDSQSILAFHGTKKENIKSIVNNNFSLSKLSSNTGSRGEYGAGIYFSEFPHVSIGYGQSLLLCRVLPGKSYDCPTVMHGSSLLHGYDSHRANADKDGRGNEIVIFHPDQILPSYVINLK